MTKVYFVHLIIDKSTDSGNSLDELEICESDYIKYDPHISNIVYCLFGWTTNKDMIESLKQMYDMDKFNITCKKVNNNELKDIEVSMNTMELYRYEFILNNEYYDKNTDIVMSKYLMESFDYRLEGLNDEMYEIDYPEYSFLKLKYIDALDKLLFCTFKHVYSEDDPEIREMALYNYTGFGLTFEGHEGIHSDINILRVFVKEYKYLLK